MIYDERKSDPALDGQSSYVWRFDDAAECGAFLRANLRERHDKSPMEWDATEGWTGGKETPEQAVERSKYGNDDLVEVAQKILDKVEAGGIETSRATWEPSVAGSYPIVGDFLAQRPNCMRRRLETEGERHPIRVVIDTTSSGGIRAAQLEQRGAAVLAFIMALAQERPVELWQITTLDARGHRKNLSGLMVRLPTAPLHLGICAHILTSQTWTRILGYGWLGQEAGAKGGWAWGPPPMSKEQEAEYNRLTRIALDMSPQDVFIPPIVLHDPLTDDPVGWINEQLRRIRGQEEFA